MSMNCCLAGCLQCTKWIPVLFLTGVMTWAYYAYVIELCINNIDELGKQITYIILFHIFLLMFLWSYGMTIFTKPAKPTDEFYLEQADVYQIEIAQNDTAVKLILEKKGNQLPLLTRTNTMLVRYCDKCKCIKPDRAHHCGTCQQCVLKMDHHCPWVNNCVGYSNYKYFILFLGYAFIFCGYVASTSFEYFIEFWNEIKNFQPGRFHLLFLFFVSTMFALSVFSLLAYHIYLIARNCTTLESFRSPVFQATGIPDPNGFNLKMSENFKQIFGSNLLTAILPIKTQNTDGMNFTNLTNLPINYDEVNDTSKITIIGNGWGRSSNIYAEAAAGDNDPSDLELCRKSGFYQNQPKKSADNVEHFDRTQDSNYITIDSHSSIDYEDTLNSMDERSSRSFTSLNNSVSFNNINTILKKNPNFTIKTIVEHFKDDQTSQVDGITFPESDEQKLEREQNLQARITPSQSDALLLNDRFQSANPDSVNIMME